MLAIKIEIGSAHMTNPYMASNVKRAYGFYPVYFGFLDSLILGCE